jgi:hypothetical protein
VNGGWLRAAGAEEIVRPRRSGDASGRPLNFTVRRLAVQTRDVTASDRGISTSIKAAADLLWPDRVHVWPPRGRRHAYVYSA